MTQINAWVNDYTRGRIERLVEEFGGEIELAVVNAMYFNGEWKKSFEKKVTLREEFRGSLNNSIIYFMNADDSIRYSECEGFKMVSLPFKGDKIVMDFILPVSDKSLSLDTYMTLSAGVTVESIRLMLPKFELSTDYSDLSSYLFSLGVPEKGYHFPALGIPLTNEMSISQVIHKMFINIAEEGAEAAAGSGNLTVGGFGPGPDHGKYKVVEFDHPFYFVVREAEHNIIMVLGHVANL